MDEVENKTDIPLVKIYTDGGCIPNPGKGAWAVILTYGDKEKILTGYEEDTTNNRMELKLDNGSRIIVKTAGWKDLGRSF
ncbi:MAG: RNase H family protein, partial [Candidatus Hydrogenedens sp.]